MTIVATNLTAGGTAGGATSATTASVSPTANALLLLAICFYDAAGDNPAAPTSITGNGLTWELVNSVNYDPTAADFGTIWVYRAMGAAPTPGTIVIDFGATNLTRISWVLDEFTGVDTSGVNGAGAVVQSNTNLGNAVLSLTVSLAAFASAQNMSWGAFANQTANPTTYTAGSGFALTGQFSTSTSFANIAAEWKAGDDDPNLSWTAASNFKCGGVGVEIKAAAAAGEPPTPVPPMIHGRGAC